MNFHQTKQHSILKDSTLCSHHYEHLRTHLTLQRFYILVLFISYYCTFLLLHLLFLKRLENLKADQNSGTFIAEHFHIVTLYASLLILSCESHFYYFVVIFLFGTGTQISSSTIPSVSLSCHLTYNLHTH
jgi:hypothetical protein